MVSLDKSSIARKLQQTHSTAPTHMNVLLKSKVPLPSCLRTVALVYLNLSDRTAGLSEDDGGQKSMSYN